jgi:hypothetical protein
VGRTLNWRLLRMRWLFLAVTCVALPPFFSGVDPAAAVIETIYTFPFKSTYTITCPWGPYANCGLSGGNHNGTDYSLGGNSTAGEDVVAGLGGTAWHHNDFDPLTGLGCGYYIVIAHGNGHRTRYCHLNDRTVSNGQGVSRGQLIGHEGTSGATGVHLHFDTRHGGTNGSDCCSGTSVDPYAGSYSPGTYLWSTNPPSYVGTDDTVGIFASASGTWGLRNSNSPGPVDIPYFSYGTGAVPQVGDWNGDGIDTVGAIFYSCCLRWDLRNSNSAGPPNVSFFYGGGTAIPVTGDWNGDGVETIGAVYRAGCCLTWDLRNSNSAGPPDITVTYGSSTVTPVVGDWNGDGVDTIGVVFVVGSALGWDLRDSNSPGPPNYSFAYGASTALPVTGDWDRSRTDSIGAVYRAGCPHVGPARPSQRRAANDTLVRIRVVHGHPRSRRLERPVGNPYSSIDSPLASMVEWPHDRGRL